MNITEEGKNEEFSRCLGFLIPVLSASVRVAEIMAQPNNETTNDVGDEVLRFPSQDDLKADAIKAQTVIDAKKASDNEQNMTLMQGIRLYPKAVLWSLLISTCIAMEGYDIALVNNFYAFDVFNKVRPPDTSDCRDTDQRRRNMASSLLMEHIRFPPRGKLDSAMAPMLEK